MIPPNIAPLNFAIQESGDAYRVQISSTNGEPIEIQSDAPEIRIPLKAWKALLGANRGEVLGIDVSVRDDRREWHSFETISNMIAKEEIDSHLTYRLLGPLYNRWRNIGIYQRNIETFDQSPILRNESFDGGCVNCHSFCGGDPDTMTLQIRSPRYHGFPMLLVRDGVTKALVTQTDFNKTPFAYTSWHPSGRLMAFSVNTVRQFFHTTGENRDVIDLASDAIVYNIDTNTLTTTAVLSDPNVLETYPTWAPDGRHLYYCRGPQLPMEKYKEIHYDLMRIAYDPESDVWGEPEVLVAFDDTGLSVTHPRPSPDGRFLLFCMAEYGNFSIFLPSSDLYMLDLETGAHRHLGINSDRADSYHSWSSNSRWFVFSSKRRDGLFTRPYFSYCDQQGRVSKPLILPQEDPLFYDSFLKVYNVPELITGPVRVSERTLAGALVSKDKLQVQVDPRVVPQAPASGDLPPSER